MQRLETGGITTPMQLYRPTSITYLLADVTGKLLAVIRLSRQRPFCAVLANKTRLKLLILLRWNRSVSRSCRYSGRSGYNVTCERQPECLLLPTSRAHY